MEICEGGSLSDRLIEKECFSENETKPIIKQLLEIVNVAHEMDIIHCDINPSNILFTSKKSNDIKLSKHQTS